MKPAALLSLLLMLLAGCGEREEGIRLHLGLTLQPTSTVQADGGSRGFTNDRGERIRLTRAQVTLNSVEIFPCPEGAAWRWLHELSPIGTAYAHSASSPRQLGTPHVSSLEHPDGEALELGTLRPPPGRYCRVHLVFGPADEDAVDLPADGAMDGRTLLLEGEVLTASGEGSHPFRLESSGIANAELSLEGLSLSAEELESEQLISLAYDQWLNGVSPLAPDAAAQVLSNIARSTAIHSAH
jgi:hypothetical protein